MTARIYILCLPTAHTQYFATFIKFFVIIYDFLHSVSYLDIIVY